MAEFTKEQLIARAKLKINSLRGAVTQSAFTEIGSGLEVDLRLTEIALEALTAVQEQEPVYQACKEAGVWVDVWADEVFALRANGEQVRGLYAAPQLPQPAVAITQHFDTIALDTAKMVMCDVNRRDEFLGGDIQLLSRIQCRIDEACRAAMLQGAEPVSQPNKLRDGYCVMPLKLTAENGAKGALSGEFHVNNRIVCQSCGGEGCEDCNDEGGWDAEIPVSWDTIKRIHEAAVEACSLPAAPQQEADNG